MIQFNTHIKKTKEVFTIEVEESEVLKSFLKTYYNEKIPHSAWDRFK